MKKNKKLTELLELASFHISYWEGEGVGQYIEYAVDHKDYKSLEQYLKESARTMFDLEYNPDPIVISEDRLDLIGKDIFPNAIWIDQSGRAPF